MRHLKRFNESQDISNVEFDKLLDYLKNNRKHYNKLYFGSSEYNMLDTIFTHDATLSKNGIPRMGFKSGFYLTDEFMNKYNKYVKLVNEHNFVEDCLIDLKDDNYKVIIDPIEKYLFIDIKTLDDMDRIYKAIKQNKLRFNSILYNIQSNGVINRTFRIQIKYDLI